MGNTVTLTFAGDSKSLERTFQNVGDGAKQMASDMDSASTKASGFGDKIDSVGGAVGNAEGKFMGAADLLDGLGGAFGLPTEGATGMFRAFGDLSGGFEVISGLFPGLLGKLGAMIGLTTAEATATEGAAVAQGGLNAMLAANPIGAVVLAIGLLVGAFVLAWQHSETFRDIVKGALGLVKDAALGLWDFFKELPERLWGIADTIKDAITWPFRAAFDAVKGLWNNTLGRIGFEVPDWVPAIGGKGWHFPTFHQGGTVPGNPGQAVPILAMAGETVVPAGRGGGDTFVINAAAIVTETQLGDLVHQILLRKQARTGSLGFA